MNGDPVITDLNRHLDKEEKAEQLHEAHEAEIEELALQKVCDEVRKLGDLFHEAMAGEGNEPGDNAVLAGHIVVAINCPNERVREIHYQALGRAITNQVREYIIRSKREEAEQEVLDQYR